MTATPEAVMVSQAAVTEAAVIIIIIIIIIFIQKNIQHVYTT